MGVVERGGWWKGGVFGGFRGEGGEGVCGGGGVGGVGGQGMSSGRVMVPGFSRARSMAVRM